MYSDMYRDYEVTYVSNVNEFIIPIIVGIVVSIITCIVYLMALCKIFKKANRSGIAAFIPIYNIIVMLEIINKPSWQIILYFVPIVNIIVYCQVLFKLAKSFRKSNGFSIATVFFPYIFIPIIGFSDSEYIGINKEAMMGISEASSVPITKTEDIESTAPIEQTASKPTDISIGGGVYQKEYENTLLNVNQEQINQDLLASFRINEEKPLELPKEEVEKTGVDVLKNITFVDTDTSNTQTNQTEFSTDIVNKNDDVLTSDNTINESAATSEVLPTINQSNMISEETTNSNNISIGNVDYIQCKHCGATIKKDSPKCFMCGKPQ